MVSIVHCKHHRHAAHDQRERHEAHKHQGQLGFVEEGIASNTLVGAAMIRS
jgi:hypothetical protein